MSPYVQAVGWLIDPVNWEGTGGIGMRLLQHLGCSGLTLLLALCIGLPLGLAVGHTGRGREFIVPLIGALRAIPTLGVLVALALSFGIGVLPPLTALVLLALPSILGGAYSGLQSVDRATLDAARSTGFSSWQLLWQVEVPLAVPLILGGIRAACLQIIATWTVAAFLPSGGLGRFLFDGLALRDYAQMLGGAILVTGLALAVDGTFAALGRVLVPAALRVSKTMRVVR